MLLLVILALLAIIAFGVGFTIHWLFIVAAVLALVWLISRVGSAATAARPLARPIQIPSPFQSAAKASQEPIPRPTPQ